MRFLPLVLAWALFAGAAFAEDADLAARLEREMARLGSEDPAERDAALEAIVKAGRAAEGTVKKRLESEKDVDLTSRLKVALDRIDRDDLTEASWIGWTKEPLEDFARSAYPSPDGRRVAMVSADVRMFMLDAEKRKWLWDAGDHEDLPSAFSLDGRTLFGAAEGGGAFGWSADTGKGLEDLTVRGAVDRLVVWEGPGGSFALVETVYGVSRIVAVSDGTRFGPAPEVSPDGRIFRAWITSVDGRCTLHVTIINGAKPLVPETATIEVADDAGTRPPVIPDADLKTCAVTRTRAVDIVEIATGKLVRTLPVEADSVAAMPGGWLLLSKADLVWWRGEKELRRVDVGEGQYEIQAAGGLAILDDDHADRIQVRSLDTGDLVRDVPGGRLFGPRGGVFAVATPENGIVVFGGGKVLRECPAGWGRPYGNVSIGPDGTVILPGAAGDALMRAGAPDALVVLPRLHRLVGELHWSDRGLIVAAWQKFALFADDGSELERREDEGLRPEDAPYEADAIRAGPTPLVRARPGGWIRAEAEGVDVRVRAHGKDGDASFLLELDPRDVAGEGVLNRIAGMALSADGSRLAVVGPSCRSIEVWDLGARKLLRRIEAQGLKTGVTLGYSGDAETLVLHTFERTEAWNSSGQKLEGLPKETKPVQLDRWITWYAEDGFHVRDLCRGGTESVFPQGVGINLDRVLAMSPDGSRLLVERLDVGELWRLDRGDGSARAICEIHRLRGVGLLDGDLPVFLDDDGLTFLHPGTWEPWNTRGDLRGDGLAVAPDGRRFAISDGFRVTMCRKK